MQIADNWECDDSGVSGLKLKVKRGESMDRICIQVPSSSEYREFWFNRDGSFDGTGSRWVGFIDHPKEQG